MSEDLDAADLEALIAAVAARLRALLPARALAWCDETDPAAVLRLASDPAATACLPDNDEAMELHALARALAKLIAQEQNHLEALAERVLRSI